MALVAEIGLSLEMELKNVSIFEDMFACRRGLHMQFVILFPQESLPSLLCAAEMISTGFPGPF